MKTYVIGDIHGCLAAFNTLYDSLALTPEDTLITVGDYIDRGPESRGVLDRLIELRKEDNNGQAPTLIYLRGNHEIMMENATLGPQNHDFWTANGGYEALLSFGIDHDDLVNKVPREYWAFFDTLLPYHETDTHIITHAGLDPSLPLSEQNEEDLYWKRFHLAEPHVSGKILVVGHTIQKKGRPTVRDQAIGIDTHAFGQHGWLTALCLDDHSYLQADQSGDTRTGQLDL